jgi:gluconate 2-dehydrogenase gamma chain
MTCSDNSRRAFLARIGGAGLLLQSPLLMSIAACAREAVSLDEPLATLTDVEGRAFAAFASRILPAEVGPGASQAGAVYFADRALAGPFGGVLEPVRAGLADLDARATAAHGAAFADLSARQQDALMREVEATPFFELGHLLTVAGVFADPSHGGNREGVGFALLGMEHAATYSPPFGFYDAEAARESGGGR